MKLNKCPCGKTPNFLSLAFNGQGSKWAEACGDCCGTWSIEFRTKHFELDEKKCMDLAVKAWNEAPRDGGEG